MRSREGPGVSSCGKQKSGSWLKTNKTAPAGRKTPRQRSIKTAPEGSKTYKTCHWALCFSSPPSPFLPLAHSSRFQELKSQNRRIKKIMPFSRCHVSKMLYLCTDFSKNETIKSKSGFKTKYLKRLKK